MPYSGVSWTIAPSAYSNLPIIDNTGTFTIIIISLAVYDTVLYDMIFLQRLFNALLRLARMLVGLETHRPDPL